GRERSRAFAKWNSVEREAVRGAGPFPLRLARQPGAPFRRRLQRRLCRERLALLRLAQRLFRQPLSALRLRRLAAELARQREPGRLPLSDAPLRRRLFPLPASSAKLLLARLPPACAPVPPRGGVVLRLRPRRVLRTVRAASCGQCRR